MKAFQAYLVLPALILGSCESEILEIETYDYTIEQQMVCFCAQQGRWARLFVRSDTIAAATDVSNGSRLTPQEWNQYKSIKELFDAIAMIDTSLTTLVVELDPGGKYPSFLSLESKPIIIDSTIIFETDGYVSYSTRNLINHR